jgi:hypothetical protein
MLAAMKKMADINNANLSSFSPAWFFVVFWAVTILWHLTRLLH